MQLELRYVLTRCKMTRKEIAIRLEISLSTLQAWEHGVTRFKGKMLVDVCEASGFPINAIPKNVRSKARYRSGIDTPELYDVMIRNRAEYYRQLYESPARVAGREKARANRARFDELNRLETLKEGT